MERREGSCYPVSLIEIEKEKTYDSFSIPSRQIWIHDGTELSSFVKDKYEEFDARNSKIASTTVVTTTYLPRPISQHRGQPVAETGWINLNNGSCAGERWYTMQTRGV